MHEIREGEEEENVSATEGGAGEVKEEGTLKEGDGEGEWNQLRDRNS